MTDCTFFDEEQPTNGLPQWATITQVSDFLEVPRNAIRSAVRRAVENNEDWVKKEISEGGGTHYLVDTTHETYKSHERRWEQKRAAQDEYGTASSTDWYNAKNAFFSQMYPEDDSIPAYTFPPQFSWGSAGHFDDVLQRWMKFRQRLYSWGIQIFQNILAEEDQESPWQWRWGSLHGEGYPNEEEAIIAALESRLMVDVGENENPALGDPSTFSQATPMTHVKSQRFKFLNKRNDFPPF
jgi:hypothetical protein